VDKYTWSNGIRIPLLAFAVFKDYSFVESSNKKVRVYAPTQDVNNTIYKATATNAAKILEFYEDYFNATEHVPIMNLFFTPTSFDEFGTW